MTPQLFSEIRERHTKIKIGLEISELTEVPCPSGPSIPSLLIADIAKLLEALEVAMEELWFLNQNRVHDSHVTDRTKTCIEKIKQIEGGK